MGPLGPFRGGIWPGKGPLGPLGAGLALGRAPWAPYDRFCGELRLKKVIFRRIPARKSDFPENSGSNLVFFCGRKLALRLGYASGCFSGPIFDMFMICGSKIGQKKVEI